MELGEQLSFGLIVWLFKSLKENTLLYLAFIIYNWAHNLPLGSGDIEKRKTKREKYNLRM